MTVIAWDGTTMAADKQGTASGYAYAVTKIFRIKNCIVGIMGNVSHGMQLLNWFQSGMIPERWPSYTEDKNADALYVRYDGTMWFYTSDCKGYPEQILDSYIALGSGRDYALATMHLGHNAVKAIEVACELDVYCGKGIDAITLWEDDTIFEMIADRYTETNGVIRLNPDADPKPLDMKIIHYLCDNWDFAFEC